MNLMEMENVIPIWRNEFKKALQKGKNPIPIITNAMKQCCSAFEEQTMIENLKEVFEGYCKKCFPKGVR